MSSMHRHNPLSAVWRADAGDLTQRAAAWLRWAAAGVLCAYAVACAQDAWGDDTPAVDSAVVAADGPADFTCVAREAPHPTHGNGTPTNSAAAEDLAAAFVDSLKDIFLAEGIPCELVWIAEVESGFDAWAVSTAGAAGLFQLMPETAERFGLRAVSEADERFDPVLNTRAAARYLKTLRLELGSWTLAVAAYHAGEGSVRRALIAVRGSRYSDIADALPEKTRDYVVRVLNVIAAAEGISAADLPAPVS